jgi:protein SCO1/2
LLKRTFAIAVLLAATAAHAERPEVIPAGLPPALQGVALDQRLGNLLPLDARFRNEQGDEVRLGDYLGRRPVVLTLVYYECPMLCGEVLRGLTKTLKVMRFDAGREFDVLTVSIDPRETPEIAAKKKGYIEWDGRAGGAGGWHFLTGEQADIDALADAVGFRYTYDPETGQFAHASAIMVVTPEGRVGKYFYGIEYSPRDLRLGLIEASESRIGSLTDAVLLYCFHYDPATGKYGAVVMNMLRLGGAATMALVFGSIGLALIRERRRSRRAAACWRDEA